MVVLADLVALGTVRIEVVLAVEDRALGGLALERHRDHQRQVHRLGVRHGKGARVGQADRAGERVRRCSERVGTATEHLRARAELHMDLEPDHRLVVAHLAHGRGTPSKPIARSSACAACRMPRLAEGATNDLEPHRKPLGEATGDRDGRDAGQRHRRRVVVRQVHGERVCGALAELERHRRRGGRDHEVHPLEGGAEVLGDAGAHLLRGSVVRLVVPRRQRVGADHDPPPHLLAEVVVARALVHLEQVAGLGALAVAHAVVASEVGARLGGRDHVVGRDRMPRVRQLDLLHGPAQLLDEGQRAAALLGHPRFEALLVEAPRAHPHPVQALGAGQPHAFRVLDGRGVTGVPSHERGGEHGRVGDVARQRTALVERGCEGDHAVPRHGAVGGLQPDHPAERGRLADRPAGVGADCPRRGAGGHGSGRAARTTRRARAPGPTGCGRGQSRSSRWTTPWRTRPGSSCRAPARRRPAGA